MVVKDNPYIEQFDKALEEWTDERFVTRGQLRALSRFSLYLVNLADAGGWEYCGHSYKRGVPMGTLTVKSYIDDIPMVVYTSARTHTGCVVTFLRKLDAGLLEWRNDKFRQ